MTRESSRTTVERCFFFPEKVEFLQLPLLTRKVDFERTAGRVDGPGSQKLLLCAPLEYVRKNATYLRRACYLNIQVNSPDCVKKTLGWNDIVFVYSFSHNLRAKRIRSITFMSISAYFPISHGGRHSKWKVEELLDAWDARRAREGVRMKGVLLLLHVPFRTPATQAVFQLKRVSIKESSHFCKAL